MSHIVELFNDEREYGQEFDTGYGVVGGDVVLEVEPVYTDERFDSYNSYGTLGTYGDANVLTGVKVLGATFYAKGNNGVELGEFDVLSKWEEYIDEDELLTIVERLEG